MIRAVLLGGILTVILLLIGPAAVPAQPAAADETEAAEWRYHTSDTFQIIYRGDDPHAVAAATELAMIAPRVWQRTTTQMRYAPTKRVPVVLRSDTARANGYFTPLPPHIEIFISSPSRYQLGAATPSWIEQAFTHELVHYLHITRPRGFFGVASRVFGPLTAAGSVLFMPGWALEAPTVYAETTLTPGGRGEDAFFAMTWLAPIYERRMYDYDQAGFSPALPPRDRIYSAGYLINDHIRRAYGDDAYHTLNDAFVRWPFLGMRRAIVRATGLSADALWWEMRRNIELRSAERFALPPGVPVSPPDLIAHWHLVAETERGLVAWAAGPRAPGALYLLPRGADLTVPALPDDKKPTTTGGTGAWQRLLSVSPLDESSVTVDRALSRVVVAVAAPDYTGAGPRVSHSDLLLLTLGDGPVDDRHGELSVSTRTQLTRGGHFFHPNISPDGARLVAVERKGSYARLVSVSLEDGAVNPLYAPTATRLHTPQFSPDGRLVAVVENHAGRQDVVILSAETGELVARVGSEEDAEYDPRFTGTTDGEYRLIYGSDAPGRLVLREVYLPDAAEPGATTVPRINGPTIAEDPIGAFAGIRHRDTLVYATYRSTGFALRANSRTHEDVTNQAATAETTKLFAPLPNQESVIPGMTENSERAPNTIVDSRESADLLQNKRYRDLLRPVFWFPLAALRGGTDRNISADLGMYALAASTLEQHELELTALYSPTFRQPWGSLAYRYTPGAATWQISAGRQFDSDETRRDTAGDPTGGRYAVNTSVERALWYRRTEAGQRRIVAAFGGGYTWNDGGAVNATVAARAIGVRDGAPGLFFGHSSVNLTSRATVKHSLSDGDSSEISTITDGGMRWWLRRTRWYVTPEAALVTNTTGDASNLVPYRGGGFDPADENAITSTGVALLGRPGVSLDLGPIDAAARGIAGSGGAVTLYAEQLVAPGTGGTIIQMDNQTVVGTELAADLFFNTIPLRVTGGVAMRVPHTRDGAQEVLFYFNLGGLAAEQVSVEPLMP